MLLGPLAKLVCSGKELQYCTMQYRFSSFELFGTKVIKLCSSWSRFMLCIVLLNTTLQPIKAVVRYSSSSYQIGASFKAYSQQKGFCSIWVKAMLDWLRCRTIIRNVNLLCYSWCIPLSPSQITRLQTVCLEVFEPTCAIAWWAHI